MVYCEIEEIKEALKSVRIEENVNESEILKQMKPIIEQHNYILQYAHIMQYIFFSTNKGKKYEILFAIFSTFPHFFKLFHYPLLYNNITDSAWVFHFEYIEKHECVVLSTSNQNKKTCS